MGWPGGARRSCAREDEVRRFVKFGLEAVAAVGVLVGSLARPAGAVTVTDAQYGFSFSLPAAWTQVPLDSALIGKFLDAAAKNDPSLKKVLGNEVAQATKEHLKFLAIGPVARGFFPNMNIALETSPSLSSGTAFLALMRAQVKELLTGLGVRQLKVFVTKAHFGTAVEANYAFPIASAPRGLVQGIQVYLVHGPRLYVITFTANTQKQDVAAAQVVEASWHWI
jgi:hypothetical protein